MVTDWAKDKITLEKIEQNIGVSIPVYSMQGNGVNGTHALSILFPQTSATQTISCYFKSGTNTLVQLATGSYFDETANFKLANGTITRQYYRNLGVTITPGPNDWYRCSLPFASSTARSFLIYSITSPTTTRNQFNTTTRINLVAVPQLELKSSPTSYIFTGATSVPREAGVIRYDLNLSVFRLYGSRDFTGPK
jgi:hypothetical protein